MNICKLITSLIRNSVHNLKIFRDFVKRIFTILLRIQHESDFLSTTDKPKFVTFLVFVSSFQNILKEDAILASVAKR